MKIADVIAHLESIAHPSLQEDYDNAGLITGDADWECSGAIISLDATEEVVQEAIDKKCNLVISAPSHCFSRVEKNQWKKLCRENHYQRPSKMISPFMPFIPILIMCGRA